MSPTSTLEDNAPFATVGNEAVLIKEIAAFCAASDKLLAILVGGASPDPTGGVPVPVAVLAISPASISGCVIAY